MISATVVITVGVQVYRNVQNYQINKQRFVSEVQQALDLSVEVYYANQAKNEIFILNSFDSTDKFIFSDSLMSLNGPIDVDTSWVEERVLGQDITIRNRANTTGVSISFQSDKIPIEIGIIDSLIKNTNSSIAGVKLTRDSRLLEAKGSFRSFTNRMFFAMTKELDFEKMDSLLIGELERKNITVNHALWHFVRDTVRKSNPEKYPLYTVSKSTYLPNNQELHMKFENASMFILKRGAFDLLISLLISGAVIGSLMYLYRIINEQKQLAEIKNDLISNITHEFKTPIATVSTAIEAISNFNQANDKEKTAKYLDISSNQLKKLNGMVEKLLETASLDSDELDLNLESVELVKFTQQIFERFQVIKGDKKLIFQTEMSERFAEIDLFHMENAVANLVDNAIKYGGDEIVIKLSEEGEKTLWHVVDNDNKLDKLQQERIFDQFYRVPTGNVHDVKGFGIGLYYTKKIVEKHEGEISVDVSSNTKFTIAI